MIQAPKPGSIWISKTNPEMKVVIEDSFIETDEAPPVLIVDASIQGDEIGLNLVGDEWESFVMENALTPA